MFFDLIQLEEGLYKMLYESIHIENRFYTKLFVWIQIENRLKEMLFDVIQIENMFLVHCKKKNWQIVAAFLIAYKSHVAAGVAFTPLRVSTSVVFGDHRIPGRTDDLQPFFGNPCAHGQIWRPPHQHLEVEFLEIFTWRFASSWEVGWPPRKRHPTRRTADSWEVRRPPTFVLPSGTIKTQEAIEKIGGIINSHYSIKNIHGKRTHLYACSYS